MEGLGKYLFGDRIKEERTLEKIEEQIYDATKMFADVHFKKDTCWPYEIDENNNKATKLSFSTTAMILASLNALQNPKQRRASSHYPKHKGFPTFKKTISPKLAKRITQATKMLMESAKAEPGTICDSNTYGKDDLMSLGWLADLLATGKIDEEFKNLPNKLARIIRKKIRKISNCGDGSKIAEAVMQPGADVENKANANDSSYTLIRFARLLISIKEGPLKSNILSEEGKKIKEIKESLFNRFETRCHDHLSFYKIPDSRFDPAELAFCLEGMLLIRRDAVGKSLFDRIMEVMRKTQDTAPNWRTETPMISFVKGYALFPVSIETANSLLTSICLHTDNNDRYDTVSSDHIDIILRYWEWLKARRSMVSFSEAKTKTKAEPVTVFGWHSEHINNPSLIHTWETSQVLEFLLTFSDLLHRHMARKSLVLSHLDVKRPDWHDMLSKGIKEKNSIKDDDAIPVNIWDFFTQQYGPVKSLTGKLGKLSKKCSVYEQVGEHFYDPRRGKDGDRAWSMLLYGPPGTGKSTLGKSLAAALEIPFITVTVSDFLAGGELEMESRAKMIFKVLELQPVSVVLFDEIDQFLLDRDSKLFRKQDSAFQFLTPGMLTKIADLRDSKRVIFIIATNYEERIDPAIKRTGRIDHKLILLPPDGKQRINIISDLVQNEIVKENKKAEKADPPEKTIIQTRLKTLSAFNILINDDTGNDLKKSSLYLGFSDIKRALTIKKGPLDPKEQFQNLTENLLLQDPAFRLTQYLERFAKKKNAAGDKVGNLSKGPGEELAALLKMYTDSKTDVSKSTKDYEEFVKNMNDRFDVKKVQDIYSEFVTTTATTGKKTSTPTKKKSAKKKVPATK